MEGRSSDLQLLYTPSEAEALRPQLYMQPQPSPLPLEEVMLIFISSTGEEYDSHSIACPAFIILVAFLTMSMLRLCRKPVATTQDVSSQTVGDGIDKRDEKEKDMQQMLHV